MKLDAARTRPTPRPAAKGYTAAQAKAATRIQRQRSVASLRWSAWSLKLIAYLGYTDPTLVYIYTKAVPPSIHFLKYARLTLRHTTLK
eukprot:scaffold24244_cov63-Phaeocystis_antarctica.AAC.4